VAKIGSKTSTRRAPRWWPAFYRADLWTFTLDPTAVAQGESALAPVALAATAATPVVFSGTGTAALAPVTLSGVATQLSPPGTAALVGSPSENSVGNTAATTVQATLAVSPGETIVVFGSCGSSAGVPVITCADDVGGNYGGSSLATPNDAGNQQCAFAFVAPSSAGGTVTITVSFSASVPYRAIGVLRVSGTSGTPLAAGLFTTGSTTASSGTITVPAGQSGLLVGLALDSSGVGAPTADTGSGFASVGGLWTLGGGSNQAVIESKAVTAGATAATFGAANNPTLAIGIFLPSAGGVDSYATATVASVGFSGAATVQTAATSVATFDVSPVGVDATAATVMPVAPPFPSFGPPPPPKVRRGLDGYTQQPALDQPSYLSFFVPPTTATTVVMTLAGGRAPSRAGRMSTVVSAQLTGASDRSNAGLVSGQLVLTVGGASTHDAAPGPTGSRTATLGGSRSAAKSGRETIVRIQLLGAARAHEAHGRETVTLGATLGGRSTGAHSGGFSTAATLSVPLSGVRTRERHGRATMLVLPQLSGAAHRGLEGGVLRLNTSTLGGAKSRSARGGISTAAQATLPLGGARSRERHGGVVTAHQSVLGARRGARSHGALTGAVVGQLGGKARAEGHGRIAALAQLTLPLGGARSRERRGGISTQVWVGVGSARSRERHGGLSSVALVTVPIGGARSRERHGRVAVAVTSTLGAARAREARGVETTTVRSLLGAAAAKVRAGRETLVRVLTLGGLRAREAHGREAGSMVGQLSGRRTAEQHGRMLGGSVSGLPLGGLRTRERHGQISTMQTLALASRRTVVHAGGFVGVQVSRLGAAFTDAHNGYLRQLTGSIVSLGGGASKERHGAIVAFRILDLPGDVKITVSRDRWVTIWRTPALTDLIVGERPRFAFEFTRGDPLHLGELYDPDTIRITVEMPNGNGTTKRDLSSSVVRDALGQYAVYVPLTVPGRWSIRAVGTGPSGTSVAQRYTFDVQP